MDRCDLDVLVESVSARAAVRPEAVQEHLDSLTKPPGSLGLLEAVAARLAAILGDPPPPLARKTVCVLAGDHGVAEEGVSAYPAEVTAQMCANFASGGAAINVLARTLGVQVVVVDVGVRADIRHVPHVLHRKVRAGTRNLAREAALTEDEVLAAIAVGAGLIEEVGRPDVIALGEMGIANTTAATALTAAFIGGPVEEVAGRGTGIDDEGLRRKLAAVSAGLGRVAGERDALRILAEVGGLEIAGLVGLILAAAASNRPIVLDGFITGAAALVACELCPAANRYLIASHLSREPGHAIQLDHLGLEPALSMGMHLGEGSGAVLMLHILESAAAILREMATFESAGVSERSS
jgi:nicotinate-nucleotide--dimethylbenzimidazole phosphoribosyltransferase